MKKMFFIIPVLILLMPSISFPLDEIHGYAVNVSRKQIVITKNNREYFRKEIKDAEIYFGSDIEVILSYPKSFYVIEDGVINSMDKLGEINNGTDVTGDGKNDIIFFFVTSGHRSIEVFRLSLGNEVQVAEHFITTDPSKVAFDSPPINNFNNYNDFFGRYGLVVLCRQRGDSYFLARDIMNWWSE